MLGSKHVLVSWSETSVESGCDLARSVIFPLPRGSRSAPTAGGHPSFLEDASLVSFREKELFPSAAPVVWHRSARLPVSSVTMAEGCQDSLSDIYDKDHST